MWQAAKSNEADEVRRLLAAGRNPDEVGPDGTTALHAAARHGHAEVAEILLAAGADPNHADPHGNGPLWSAVHEASLPGRTDGSLEVVRLLVAASADPDHKNRYGQSPRDSAERRDWFIAGLLPRRVEQAEPGAAADGGA